MSGGAPRIHAQTLHVDELVDRAMRGRIRVPSFQRGLKWTGENVRELFDSLWRGYPIGTLLMWRRPAEAGRIALGPVEIDVPAAEDAWWVVDGQQRLTSLVAGLHHPGVVLGDDPFLVHVDLMAVACGADDTPFFRPGRERRPADTDLPVSRLLDAGALQGWILDAVQRTGNRDLVQPASEVATRIRNYRVPVYVVETDDADTARRIFLRTNQAGRRMEMHEVFAALAPPSTSRDVEPASIAERLSSAWGPVDPNVVVKAARALVGDDVTHGPGRPGDPDRELWMDRTERALRAALGFLAQAGIVHTRLLPARRTPVVVLARFFDRFPDPHDRSLRLLRRWLWRGLFADALASDARTLRRAVVAVGHDESHALQALLGQVPRTVEIALADRFDARHGPPRLAMLAMAIAGPLRIGDADPTLFAPDTTGGVFDWLQQHGPRAFTRLDPRSPDVPELRFLTPGTTASALREQLLAWAREDFDHPGLASHRVSAEAARALGRGDVDAFARERRASLEAWLVDLHRRYAEPEHLDRPPLDLAP